MSVDEVFQICKIDPWFLVQIEDIWCVRKTRSRGAISLR
jgi:hypothetical protein